MVSKGQKLALDFPVRVMRDGRAKEVQFAELLTRRSIVALYMKNNTPTCDRQNASLAALAAEFDSAGYDVIAVSHDTCGSQARYAATHQLPFTLVSDPQHHFARAADALVEKSMYGRTFIGPARAAFVLERDGTILAVVPKLEATNCATELMEVINSL